MPLQELGSGYMGTYSMMRNEPQSSRRSAGKHRGNKVKLPTWRGHAIEVLSASRTRAKRTTVLSSRERAIVEDLQAKRVALLNMAGNNSQVD